MKFNYTLTNVSAAFRLTAILFHRTGPERMMNKTTGYYTDYRYCFYFYAGSLPVVC